jgi:hypothetical protein
MMGTTMHYTELPEIPPNQPFAREWAVYLRELPRWLAEGQEGRFVLIKDGEVIGLWDTWRETVDTGRARFGMVPFMVHEIQEWEPVYRQRYI